MMDDENAAQAVSKARYFSARIYSVKCCTIQHAGDHTERKKTLFLFF